MSTPTIGPLDAANRRTLAQGHPADRRPPHGDSTYDLIVIGGGPAGLSAAIAAVKAGNTVAVVERNILGGTCVNFGCTPSKALIRAARAIHAAREGEKFGYRLGDRPTVDFAAVMTRVREMRADASAKDSLSSLMKTGVDVWLGDARFVDRATIAVEGRQLQFKKAVVATGSGPAVPDVPGLRDAAYLTNETLFEMTEQPHHLICLGGGVINCELAQSFCRLGSQVDLVGSAVTLLGHEAAVASDLLARRLTAEGVRLHLGTRATRVDEQRRCVMLSNGTVLAYDAVLVAAGRRVRVDGLDLGTAGVAFDADGIEIDEHLRTTNPNVYAAGDVAIPEKLTHAAVATGVLAAENALGKGAPRCVRDLVIPRCTYTDPEIAQVGPTPAEAAERGMAVDTHRLAMADVERARIDGETDGFVDLHVHDGIIVGATLVSSHAGESIPLLTAAVMQKMKPAALAAVIHCYPTQALAVQTAAEQAAGPRT